MYCRAHQALPSKPKINQTGQELMEEWIYLHGLVGKPATAFRYISTTRARTAKRTTPLDPAYRIGVSTISKDVLTVDEGVCGWLFKNREIGHVFDYSSTARPRTSKRRTALKSARQIGVSTISKDVLTVDEGVSGWIFKNREIGHVFDYSSTARPRTSKRRTAMEAARQIGVSTISKDVLTVDEGVC